MLSGMPFPFLDLPPEIRERIYVLVCHDPNFISLSTSEPQHAYFPHALLLTCHQLYQEVGHLYFTTNKFAITLDRHNGPLSYFLGKSFNQDNLRSITTLRLTILRWGAKDYFLERFAPALSDMILIGRLRHLEVNLKRQDLNAYDATRDRWGFDKVFKELIKICEDPYLETVQLQTFEPTEAKSGLLNEPKEFNDVTYLLERGSKI